MAKLSDHGLIREALETAIKWEESYYDAYAGVTSPEGLKIKRQTKSIIQSYTDLLNRRFGGKRPDPFADAERVSLDDIRKSQP